MLSMGLYKVLYVPLGEVREKLTKFNFYRNPSRKSHKLWAYCSFAGKA